MDELILVLDEELDEDDLETQICRRCGFEQEVPVEWEMSDSGNNIICSTCWLEDRWDQEAAKKQPAAEKPPQSPVAKKGQQRLFDK